jgi:hypothetical protein
MLTSDKTAIDDNEPYGDTKKKARKSMSFQANGSHIRILAIGYLAKVIRSLHMLQSPWLDDFAWISSFFKAKAVRPVELALAATNSTLVYTCWAHARFCFS